MSLRQILLVLKREYLTKIKSKAFILATLLIPLGMVAFITVMFTIMLWESDSEHLIGIVDETNQVVEQLEKIDEKTYINLSDLSEDSLRSLVVAQEIEGYIQLSDSNVVNGKDPELVYGGSGGIKLQSDIRSDLREAIRQVRLQRANVSQDIQNIYESRIGLSTRKLTKEGEETEDNTGFLTGIGVAMGVIIFSGLFGYGGLLTRSVIEEKTNRIIEVIASSVKPIELLLGKMAGIGALALTQIGFWLLTFFGLSAAAAPIAGMLMQSNMEELNEMAGQTEAPQELAFLELPQIDPMIYVYFFVFFILGYMIYSALFAAIGSAVDSETDTQQFMMPIFLPIMIAYFIMFQAMENPDGSLAVIGSLIPFFSPIVMITRIAITDVPFWQIGSSIVFMLITFMGTMWLSAKIYSVGILSYGKSASFKELWKWIKQG